MQLLNFFLINLVLLFSVGITYPVSFPYDHGLVVAQNIPLSGSYPLSGSINNTIPNQDCFSVVHQVTGVVEPQGPLNSAIYFTISIVVSDSLSVTLFSVPSSSSLTTGQTIYDITHSTGNVNVGSSMNVANCNSGTCTFQYYCEIFNDETYYVEIQGIGTVSGAEEISYTLTVFEYVENITVISRFYTENTVQVDRFSANNVGPQNFVHYFTTLNFADIEKSSNSFFFFQVVLSNISQAGTSGLCISTQNMVGTETDIKSFATTTSECVVCASGTGTVSITLSSVCCLSSENLWIGVRTPSSSSGSTFSINIGPQNSEYLPNPILLSNGEVVTGTITTEADSNCNGQKGQYPCEQLYYQPKLTIPSNPLIGPVFYASVNSVYDGQVILSVSSGYYANQQSGCINAGCGVFSTCTATPETDCQIEIPYCDWDTNNVNWEIVVTGNSLLNGTTVTYALNVTQYTPTISTIANLFRDGDADPIFGRVYPLEHDFYSFTVDQSAISPDARLTITIYSETTSEPVMIYYNFGSPASDENCYTYTSTCETNVAGNGNALDTLGKDYCRIELYSCDNGMYGPQLLAGTHYFTVGANGAFNQNYYHAREYTVTVELNYAKQLNEYVATPIYQLENEIRFFSFRPPYEEIEISDGYILLDRIIGSVDVYVQCGNVAGPCNCWTSQLSAQTSPYNGGTKNAQHEELLIELGGSLCDCKEEVYIGVVATNNVDLAYDISIQYIRFPSIPLFFGNQIYTYTTTKINLESINNNFYYTNFPLQPFSINFEEHDEIYIEIIPSWIDDNNLYNVQGSFTLQDYANKNFCRETIETCVFDSASDLFNGTIVAHNYPWKCIMIARNCPSCQYSGEYFIQAVIALNGPNPNTVQKNSNNAVLPEIAFTINVQVRKNIPLSLAIPSELKARVRSGEYQHFVVDLSAINKPLNSWIRVSFYVAPTVANNISIYLHYSDSRNTLNLAGKSEDCYMKDCSPMIIDKSNGFHMDLDPCDFAQMKGLYFFSIHNPQQGQNAMVNPFYDYFNQVSQVTIQIEQKNTYELLATQVPISRQLYIGEFDYYSVTIPSQFPSGVIGYDLNVVFESVVQDSIFVKRLSTNPTSFCDICSSAAFQQDSVVGTLANEYRFEERICSQNLSNVFYFAIGFADTNEFTPASYVARAYLIPFYLQSISLSPTNFNSNSSSNFGLIASYSNINNSFTIQGQEYLVFSFSVNAVAGSIIDLQSSVPDSNSFAGDLYIDNLCSIAVSTCTTSSSSTTCNIRYEFCSGGTHTLYFLVDASKFPLSLSDNVTISVNLFNPIANVINVPSLGNNTQVMSSISVPAASNFQGALGLVGYTAPVSANAGDTITVTYNGAAQMSLFLNGPGCNPDCIQSSCTIRYCSNQQSTYFFLFTSTSGSDSSDSITIQRMTVPSNITIDPTSNPLPINNVTNFGSLVSGEWRYHSVVIPVETDASFSIMTTGISSSELFAPTGSNNPVYFPGYTNGIFFDGQNCPSGPYNLPTFSCCTKGINQVFAVVGPVGSYTLEPILTVYDGQNFGTQNFNGNRFSVSSTIVPNTINFMQFTISSNSAATATATVDIYYELQSNVTTGIAFSPTSKAGNLEYGFSFSNIGNCYDASPYAFESCPSGASSGSPCFGVLQCLDCYNTGGIFSGQYTLSLFSNSYSSFNLTVYSYPTSINNVGTSISNNFVYPVINTTLANSNTQSNNYGQYSDFLFSINNNFGSNQFFVPVPSDIPNGQQARYTIYIQNVVAIQNGQSIGTFPFNVYVNIGSLARPSGNCLGGNVNLANFCIGGVISNSTSWSCTFDYCMTCGDFSLYYSIINSQTGSYTYSTYVNQSLSDVTQYVSFETASSSSGLTNITNAFGTYTTTYVTIPFGSLSDTSRHEIIVYGSNVVLNSVDLYSTLGCNSLISSLGSINVGQSVYFDVDPCYSGKYSALYPSLILRVTVQSVSNSSFFVINNQIINREVVFNGSVPTTGLTLVKEIVDRQYEFFQFQLPTDSGYSFFTITVSGLSCNAAGSPGLQSYFSYYNNNGNPVDVVRPNRVPSSQCEGNSMSLQISNDDLCSYFGGVILLTVYSQPGDQLFSTPDTILGNIAAYYTVTVQYNELARVILSPLCSYSFSYDSSTSIKRYEVDFSGYPQLSSNFQFDIGSSSAPGAFTLLYSFNAQAFGTSETNCVSWNEKGDFSTTSISEPINGLCMFPRKVYLYLDDSRAGASKNGDLITIYPSVNNNRYTPVFVADSFGGFTTPSESPVSYIDSLADGAIQYYRVINPESFVEISIPENLCNCASNVQISLLNANCGVYQANITLPYILSPCNDCSEYYIQVVSNNQITQQLTCSYTITFEKLIPSPISPTIQNCFPITTGVYHLVDFQGNSLNALSGEISLTVDSIPLGTFVYIYTGCTQTGPFTSSYVLTEICPNDIYIVVQSNNCRSQFEIAYNLIANPPFSVISAGSTLQTTDFYNLTAASGSLYQINGKIVDNSCTFACIDFAAGPGTFSFTSSSGVQQVAVSSFTNGQMYTIASTQSYIVLSIPLPTGTSKINLALENIAFCSHDSPTLSYGSIYDGQSNCGFSLTTIAIKNSDCTSLSLSFTPCLYTQTNLFVYIQRSAGECDISFNAVASFTSISTSQIGIPHTGSPIRAFVQESECGGGASYSASYIATVGTNGIFYPFITETNFLTTATITATSGCLSKDTISCTAFDDNDGFSSSCLAGIYSEINCGASQSYLVTVSASGSEFVDFGFQVVNQFTPLSGPISTSILGNYIHAWSVTGLALNSYTIDLQIISGPALELLVSYDCFLGSCFSESFYCDHGSCSFSVSTLADHPGSNNAYIQIISNAQSSQNVVGSGYNRLRMIDTETTTFYNLNVLIGSQNCISVPSSNSSLAPFCSSSNDDIFTSYVSSTIWNFNVTEHDLSAQCLYNQLRSVCSYRSTDCSHALKAYACALSFPSCDANGFITTPSQTICQQIVSTCGIYLNCDALVFIPTLTSSSSSSSSSGIISGATNISSTDLLFTPSPTPITAAFSFPSSSPSNSPYPSSTFTFVVTAPQIIIQLPNGLIIGSPLPSGVFGGSTTSTPTHLPPGVSRSSTFTVGPVINSAVSFGGFLCVNVLMILISFLFLNA